MVCGYAHDVSEQHHAHGHAISVDATHTSLVFGDVCSAWPVGTEVTPNSGHAEGTPLIGVITKTLGCVSIPDVVHTISFDLLVEGADRFMMGNSIFVHFD